jgi:hypothetical protein
LDACDADENAAVEAHLSTCDSCAAEARRLRSAAGWLGADRPVAAPAALRHAVLARARQVRPPARARTLVAAYASQAALLDEALTQLVAAVGPDAWELPEGHHRTVGGVVEHLARNDAMLAADIGLHIGSAGAVPTGGPEVRHAWRRQTEILVQGLADIADLDRPVRLASAAGPQPGRLRDALVQRAFETWIHLEDLGATVDLEDLGSTVHMPQSTPPPEQLRRIVDLAAGLLPAALRAAGLTVVLRLVLGGTGGGDWRITTGTVATDLTTDADLTIRADLAEFARLIAGRRSQSTLRYTAAGDQDLAARVLRVAATLGCD